MGSYKKIGVVTMFSNSNYGCLLQCYAVKTILSKFGYKSEILVPVRHVHIEAFRKYTMKVLRYLYSLVNEEPRYYIYKRLSKMDYFIKNNLDWKYVNTKKLKAGRFNDTYAAYCVGSDQIWNPYCIEYDPEIVFLPFVDNSHKFAIAPSIAVENVPSKFIYDCKKYLVDFRYISVREKSGAQLLENILGRHVPFMIDPTLMLDKCDWDRIADLSSIKEDEDYLVTYFLGELNPERRQIIDELSEKYHLKVISMLDLNDKLHYSISPAEFLYLIKNAKIVCTDSFHATVFSLIWEKAFWVFSKEVGGKLATDNGSRVENLLELFGQRDRLLLQNRIESLDKTFDVNFENNSDFIESRVSALKCIGSYFENLKKVLVDTPKQ